MPEEIKKGQELGSSEKQAEDIEIFANRKIAELTARVDSLKEYFQTQKKELAAGENFDREIAEMEKILADFEVSVRDILQTDGALPDAQKKATIESLKKETDSQIQNFASDLNQPAPKQGDEKPSTDTANVLETKSGDNKSILAELETYEKMAYDSVFEAMSLVKDKKTAQLLREKYDNFLTDGKKLAENDKFGNAEKLIEQRYQEFLTEIGNIVDKEQLGHQEPIEVTMQEAKPEKPKVVASLDDSLSVDKDTIVPDEDKGEKATENVVEKEIEPESVEAEILSPEESARLFPTRSGAVEEAIYEDEAKKKKSFKEKVGESARGFKELSKTKKGREFLVKTAYDTAATVFGVKFATDLALMLVGKGDIFNYLKEKSEIREEKTSIKEFLVSGEKIKIKEIIENSKNISAEEKKALLDRLELLDKEYADKSKDLEAEKQVRVQETLNAYIQNKTKGAKIARDALNTAFMATGLGAFRGGAYLLGSMAERMQKASTTHDKEMFALEVEELEGEKIQEAKMHFILKDLVVNSTLETLRSLAGKGKTKDSEHKTMDRIQAVGTVARALGLGATMINAESFTGSMDELLDNVQKQGIAGGAWSTMKDNFVDNADRIFLGALPDEAQTNPEFTAESKGGLSTWEQMQNLYDNKTDEDNLVPNDHGIKEVVIDTNGANIKEVETVANTHFENIIDSSEVKGADSIWRSTHDIFETHAKDLGYQGDPNDSQALSKWAESQTANVVNQLSQEQGGSVADLVHDGDKVSIEMVNGQPHLSFEASSGIEAGHLADTNIEHLPDSQHQEVSPVESSEFLEDKNISTPTEVETASVNELAKNAVDFKEATIDRIEALVDKGEGAYSHDMFGVAKENGQLDEIFKHILSGNDRQQAESFVADYFRDNGLSHNKRDIFSFELNKILGTEEAKSYSGDIDEMVTSFDQNVITNFKDLEEHFDANSNHDWTAVRIGDRYALVRRTGGGLFGKVKYLVDLNGDGESESLKPNAEAMKEVFEGKRPLGERSGAHHQPEVF